MRRNDAQLNDEKGSGVISSLRNVLDLILRAFE